MVTKPPTKKPRVVKPSLAKAVPKKVKLPEVSFTDFNTDFNTKTFSCTRCGLCQQRINYVLPHGNFNGEILIVGDIPGPEEDRSGTPFTGNLGRLLREALDTAKLPVGNVLVTNACFCRPPKGRQPAREELAACVPHIKNIINNMPNLRLVILLGNNALGAVLKQQRILDKRGTLIRKEGKVYLPILHPAAILRNPEHKQSFIRDFMFAYEYLYGTIKTGTYTCCDTLDTILTALAAMEDQEIVAFDIETSSTEGSKEMSNFMVDDIIGFSFTAKEYEGYYVPLIASGEELWEPETKAHIINRAKEVFGGENKKLILHNGKFDLNFIKKSWGLDLTEPITREGITGYRYYFDTMLAHHLLWQDPPHDLKFLSRRFPDLSYYESELDEYKQRNKIKNYAKIPKDIIYKYAAADADATLRLYNIYAPDLVKYNLWTLMFGITMPLANTLIHTEYYGVKMDRAELLNVKQRLIGEAELLHKEIIDLAGENFNINSKKQLIHILFEKLKLPIPTKRTEGNAISTDRETLESLDHPICKKIIEYSTKMHFLATYINGMLDRLDDQDIMRTRYNQHRVATGRLCVAGDTILKTDSGDFAINEFSWTKGAERAILTHTGSHKKILNKYYKGKEEMFLVTLTNGSSIKCTNGHRFLTPNGWRHLYELKVGEDVCTYKDKNTRNKATCSKRGKFLPHFFGRKAHKSTNNAEVSAGTLLCGMDAQILLFKVQETVRRFTTSALQQCTTWKYTWRKSTGKDTAEKGIKTTAIPGEVSGTDSSYFSDECILSEAQYRVPQIAEGRKRPLGNAGIRFGIFRKIRNIVSRNAQGCKKLFNRPGHVLYNIIRKLPGIVTNNLVYKSVFATLRPLQISEKTPKKPYLLEFKQIRDAVIHNITKCWDTTCTTILCKQNTYSRLCFSGAQIGSRNRRWLPSESHGADFIRFTKGKDTTQDGVQAVTILDRNCLEKSGASCFSDKVSPIKSIVSVGILDVWDIEVEDDHSYCAHGFINHNSSSDPNLQNIPATDDFRKLFIARPGHSFIMSDFSQIELRVLAHVSKDETLIDAFQTGKDLHSITGRAIFYKEPDAVLTKEERRVAKTVNFGIVYGIMETSLAKQTGATEEAAGGYIKGFYKLYPMITVYQKQLLAGLRKNKFVQNLFGRYHHIPDIDHPNDYIRGEAERTATNSPVQGTAGDITNLAAIRIFSRLRAANIPAMLVLQIHDELVYDVPDNYILPASKIIYQTMRETAEHYLSVPVLVDQAVNDKWIEPKLYKQARYLKKRGLTLKQFHAYMDEYEAKKLEAKASSTKSV
jgi:uracil-DNA glycosylase family 4